MADGEMKEMDYGKPLTPEQVAALHEAMETMKQVHEKLEQHNIDHYIAIGPCSQTASTYVWRWYRVLELLVSMEHFMAAPSWDVKEMKQAMDKKYCEPGCDHCPGNVHQEPGKAAGHIDRIVREEG